ncbi:MAG: TMEM43 family protein [Verrucomicrobiales bacterium]
MAFTETQNISWFGRMKNSFMGVIVGLLMFAGSFFVLFKNEGCAVRTAKGLEQGRKEVVSSGTDAAAPGNEGKLVHISGQAATDAVLKDPKFGVEEAALRLRRKVEMFQWKEIKETKTKDKIGGGQERVTTYDYRKEWSEDAISSANFKEGGHTNPPMPFRSEQFVASNAMVGAFRLPESLASQIGGEESLPITEEIHGALPEDLKAKFRAEGGGLYMGKESGSPAVGDVRVAFSVVRSPKDVSVLGAQQGNSFAPFATEYDTKIFDLRDGIHTAEAMIQMAERENTIRTWLLRGGGFVMMAIGIGMILGPISAMAMVLPFLGRLAGAGVGFVAFIGAGAFSLVTIAFAWIWYRPMLGIPLLVGGIVLIVWIIKRAMAKGRPPTPAAAAAGGGFYTPPPPPE